MWVTHQNLARAKGGRAHYEHRQRKGLPQNVTGAPPAPAPKPEGATENATPETETKPE